MKTSYNTATILRYIVRYKVEHDGNSPTIRQICTECDVVSTSVASYLLRGMQKAGFIRLSAGDSRGIEVVGGYMNHPVYSRSVDE